MNLPNFSLEYEGIPRSSIRLLQALMEMPHFSCLLLARLFQPNPPISREFFYLSAGPAEKRRRGEAALPHH
jgi:hypothetical protein